MIKLKDYFRFNSRERLAIILLTCLMAIFWILPEFYPSKPLPNIIAAEQKVHPTKPQNLNRETDFPNDHTFRKPDKTEVDKPVTYFYFDPNKIGAKQWQSLGLSSKTVQTIINYRNKGGLFRKPEDLRKIWGLKPELADKLIPFIAIPDLNNSSKDSTARTKTQMDSAVVKKKQPTKKININTAMEEEWRLFPGIGEVLSARIVKYRDKIGGFKTVEQVGKTYGIPDSVFQRMKPFLEMEEGVIIK